MERRTFFKVFPGVYGDKNQFRFDVQVWYYDNEHTWHSGGGRYCTDAKEVAEYIDRYKDA